jgi:hypothetical protein
MSEYFADRCMYCGRVNGEHADNCRTYDMEMDRATDSHIQRMFEAVESSHSTSGAAERRLSGKYFEHGLFGTIDTATPEYRRALKKVGVRNELDLDLQQAIELTKQIQNAEPTDPETQFLRDLRLAVIDKLETVSDNKIGAYSAVGTPLDLLFGVDAFITEKFGNMDLVVTLDATLNKNKQQMGGKADVIIGKFTPAEQDEDAYLGAVDKYAEKIAKRLKEIRPGSYTSAAK